MLVQGNRSSSSQAQVETIESAEVEKDISNAQLVYILFFIGYFTGFATVAALYLATKFNEESKEKPTNDNWVITHFSWQVKCFWDLVKWSSIALGIILFGIVISIFKFMHAPSETGYALYGKIFGTVFNPFLITTVVIGVLIIAISGLWHIYRMIIGFSALRNKSSIE